MSVMRFYWCCLVWLLSLAPSAKAGVDVVEQAWLADPSGRLSYADVQQAAFLPYTGILARGYSSGATWLRIRIQADDEASSTTTEKWILRIRPSFLDEVTLYDPVGPFDPSGRSPLAQYSGDRHPPGSAGYLSLNLGFLIPGSSQPRDLYLRLETSSSSIIAVEAMTPEAAALQDRHQEMLYTLYIAALLMFIFWALVHWVLRRDPVVGYFALKQIVVLLHALAFLGFGRLFLSAWIPPTTIDWLNSLAVILVVGASYSFELRLLHESRPHRWVWRAALLLSLPWLLAFAALLAGDLRQALNLNMFTGLLIPLMLLVVCASAQHWRMPNELPLVPRYTMVLFYLAFTAAAYMSVLPFLGLVEGVEMTLNMPVTTGFLSGLLMLLLLSLRERNRERLHREAELRLVQACAQADAERLRRQEKEQLLTMLTHELKTPIGVARISLESAKIDGLRGDRIARALANIDSVIERCRLSDQIEQRGLRASPEQIDLVELVQSCIVVCTAPNRVDFRANPVRQVYSDGQLLAIIISNLIDNALKYGAAASRVLVSIAAYHDGTRVTVANLVGPVGRPDPSQAFCKYYRAPEARKISGSGLGLFIAHEIARLLDGELKLLPDSDAVRFELCLPN